MRLLILAAVALSGCASYEPRDNPLAELSVDSEPPQEPLRLPDRPEPVVIQHEGAEYVAFDGAGRADLLEFVDAAEANTEIAAEHARALDAMHEAYAEAVRAGRAEHELAELRGRMLHEERRARLIEKWSWGVGGLLLLIGLQ